MVLKSCFPDPVGICLTGYQMRVRYSCAPLQCCYCSSSAFAGPHTAASPAAATLVDDTGPLDLLQDVEICIRPLGMRLAPQAGKLEPQSLQMLPAPDHGDRSGRQPVHQLFQVCQLFQGGFLL